MAGEQSLEPRALPSWHSSLIGSLFTPVSALSVNRGYESHQATKAALRGNPEGTPACVCMCVRTCVRVCVCVQSWLTLGNPWSTKLLFPWDFSGKNTGVGCHCFIQGIFFLQGIFLTQGSNPGLLCLPQVNSLTC